MEVMLTGTVTHMGKDKKAGEVLDLPERSAKSLVDGGLADYFQAQPQKAAVNTSEDEAGSKQPTGELEKAQEEELGRLSKALDDQYKRDELADAAKTIGVEFKYDAKKAEIITAAVDQGKAAALLK